MEATKRPSDIKVGKRIRKDLGDIDALAQSMKEDGQGAAITIKDGKLVDGFRRLTAWKKAFKDKPIGVFDYNGKTDTILMEAKIEGLTKKFDAEELMNAISIIENNAEKNKSGTAVSNRGIGKKLGISYKTVERTKETMNPALDKEIGKEKAEHIRKRAKEKGLYGAYEELKDERIRIANDKIKREKPPKKKPEINEFMNRIIDLLVQTNTGLEEILKNWQHLSKEVQSEYILNASVFIKLNQKYLGKDVKTWSRERKLIK